MTRYPPYQVIDDFLPQDLHDRMLAHCVANEGRFRPSKVRNYGDDGYRPGMRQSWKCEIGLGPLHDHFESLVEARREALRESLGVPPVSLWSTDIELIAHRQGSFFQPHIDTFTASNRIDRKSDRVITLVYYFHYMPRRFSGGEIAIFPFGPGKPLSIDPVNNRLVAFPSFALHEVKPIETPHGDRFEDARFAVNVWFQRERLDQ